MTFPKIVLNIEYIIAYLSHHHSSLRLYLSRYVINVPDTYRFQNRNYTYRRRYGVKTRGEERIMRPQGNIFKIISKIKYIIAYLSHHHSSLRLYLPMNVINVPDTYRFQNCNYTYTSQSGVKTRGEERIMRPQGNIQKSVSKTEYIIAYLSYHHSSLRLYLSRYVIVGSDTYCIQNCIYTYRRRYGVKTRGEEH